MKFAKRVELKCSHTHKRNLNMGGDGCLNWLIGENPCITYAHDKSPHCPLYLTILFVNYTSVKLEKNSDPYVFLYLRTLIWDLLKLATDFSYPWPSTLHAGNQKRNSSSISNFVQNAPFTDFFFTVRNVMDWKFFRNIK